MSQRPIILIICNYYLPGFESGGAMRTIVNMVERLSNEFDFRIITRDHDGPLNSKSYDTVKINNWNRIGNADVFYMSKDRTGAGDLKKLIIAVNPDAIYLNSFFSPLTVAVRLLCRLGRIRPIPVVLAPEGEFSSGALALKSVKKQLYIASAKLLGLLHTMTWKAAAESEVAEIERSLGNQADILIAPNLPPLNSGEKIGPKPDKVSGRARMVFLSRYMRKKNFNWLLEQLGAVKGDLEIDICGPIEDAEYWEKATRIIKKLPANVKVEAKGAVPYHKVAETLAGYHFFILPTLGENFGHVFVEAFAAGCPVITSDRTPWRDLKEKGIGWDLPLDDPKKWVDVINACIEMNAKEFTEMSRKASEFANTWLSDPALEESNRQVLRSAIARR